MKYIQLACAFAVSAWSLSAQAVSPDVETTGMIGIADAQTAQLNLLNPGVLPPALGVVCTAAVSFVNATGTVLKSTTLTIPPGQSMSVSIRSVDTPLNLLPGEHVEIRATITTPGIFPPTATSTGVPACKLIPTLEMLDTSSGRTLVVLGHVVTLPSAPVVTSQ